MKSPLWIINSILAVIVLALIVFIIYSLKNIIEQPQMSSIKVPPRMEAMRKEGPKPQDLRLIYETNDLFNTYKPVVTPEIEKERLPSLPLPPVRKPVITQQPPPIQFLDPLPIKITGIIASSNEAKSQVSIMNNNTNKTDSYTMGDKLFDAYIIRIFPRKIVILRSNGQQETLFMFSSDAAEELKNLHDVSWDDVVQKQTDTFFSVNPIHFASRIASLAHLIDILDITTAFKQGQSIGLHIGKMDNNSIGYALGLMPLDTIIKIQDIPPTTTKNRLKIYNKITDFNLGDKIKIQLMRHGELIAYEYELMDWPELSAPPVAAGALQAPLMPPQSAPEPMPMLPIHTTNETQEIRTAVAQSQKMPPPETKPNKDSEQIQEIKKRDKQGMYQFGSRSAMLTPNYVS